MPASSSLRQRRSRRDEENANNNNAADIINEEDEMELFAKHYKQATANNSISQCRTVLLILIGIIILAFTFVILQYNSSQTLFNRNNSSTHRRDLKLITIYPHHITSQIHNLKSQTELLITDSNKEAINAIRIGIAMSNNLHYHHTTNAKFNNNSGRTRKRKKKGVAGILLGISNFITTLRSSSNNDDVNVEEEKGYITGEVVLEPYDEVMIRNYLVEFGGRCSSNHSDGDVENRDINNNENTILKRYDEASTLIQTTADDTNLHKDILWNHIIQLFTLCQFINNDARGYIAFNTTTLSKSSKDQVSIQERLEESRLNGVGMAMKESDDDSLDVIEKGDDSLHYASLFVISNEESARDKTREMLHKRLEEDIPSSLATTAMSRQSKSSLLLE